MLAHSAFQLQGRPSGPPQWHPQSHWPQTMPPKYRKVSPSAFQPAWPAGDHLPTSTQGCLSLGLCARGKLPKWGHLDA